jgi:hypothetical protein
MFTLIARVTDGEVPQFIGTLGEFTPLTSRGVMFNAQQAAVVCNVLNDLSDGETFHYIGISVERKYDDSKATCHAYDLLLAEDGFLASLATVNWMVTSDIHQLMR